MHAAIIATLAGVSGGAVTYVAIRAAEFAWKIRHILVPAELRAKHARVSA